jgi:hypothetical protein
VGTSTTGNDLAFTFTAPSSGFTSGELVVAVPKSWSAPQTASSSSPGYVTAQAGTIQITGSKVAIEDLNLCGSCVLTFSYDDAQAPHHKGNAKFTTKSSADLFSTKLEKLASSPVVVVSKTASPGAPTGVAANPGDGSAALTWSAPTADGNEPIKSYVIDQGTTQVASTTGATSTTITGLTNGTSYALVVAACNIVGCGPFSSPPISTIPYGVPGAPSLSGSVSGSTLSWTWSDSDDNGSTITGFDIFLDGSEVAADTSATSFSQSFTYNTTHTLSIDADNAAGPGQSSTDTETTSPKTLDADATPAFGTCPSNPPPFSERYCGGSSNSCTSAAFSPGSCANVVSQGTQISALCWMTGQTIYNNYSAAAPGANATLSSNIWIEVANYPGAPWMNQLWFNPDNTAQDNLPSC